MLLGVTVVEVVAFETVVVVVLPGGRVSFVVVVVVVVDGDPGWLTSPNGPLSPGRDMTSSSIRAARPVT